MSEVWEFGGDSVSRSAGSITVLEDSTFCMAGATGDVEFGEAHGLFVQDIKRALPGWQTRRSRHSGYRSL